MNVAETARLYLRELTEDDAQNFYALNLDPDVLQYTGDSVFENVDTARFFLRNYTTVYKKKGMGRWAVIRKEDDAFLGWCGLKYDEDNKETDLGFRFFKKYWRQGYATEAATACVVLGFSKLNLPCIIGRAMEANSASVRVLEKVGFSFYQFFDFEGEDGVIYKIAP
ncbi:GNAT family N-acetyltransferase [Flavobacterium sp. RHBU_24]|uniref:GNAT family N-acetyltransferase n=1 Tax=Flavobacterium sp. RHBU_24 TaxID=3391185 RepID=UPI0039853C82